MMESFANVKQPYHSVIRLLFFIAILKILVIMISLALQYEKYCLYCVNGDFLAMVKKQHSDMGRI